MDPMTELRLQFIAASKTCAALSKAFAVASTAQLDGAPTSAVQAQQAAALQAALQPFPHLNQSMNFMGGHMGGAGAGGQLQSSSSSSSSSSSASAGLVGMQGYEGGAGGQGPSKKAKRKKKDPLAPKRPLSAYLLFCVEERKVVNTDQPDLKGRVVMNELGKRWQALSAEKKVPFTEKAKILLQEYTAKLTLFNSQIAAHQAAMQPGPNNPGTWL